MFGTLCAIDPEIQPDHLVDELPQLQLISRMLSVILASELKAETEMRRAERAEQVAESDALTGVFNRRGWVRADKKMYESKRNRKGSPNQEAGELTHLMDAINTVELATQVVADHV